MDEGSLRWMVEQLSVAHPSESCYYAVWDGNPGIPGQWADAPRYGYGHHSFYTFLVPLPHVPDFAIRLGALAIADVLTARGLDADEETVMDAVIPRSPNLLWPSDRTWVAYSDFDLDETEVCGPTHLTNLLRATVNARPRPSQRTRPTSWRAWNDDRSPER